MNNVFHMASMARSGETLLLKTLNIHDNVKIVHNLKEQESKLDCSAFEVLKIKKEYKISSNDPLFKHYELQENDILFLKQGTWEHPYNFQGFVLSRNPISIYSSLKSYDINNSKYNLKNNFWFNNNERLLRWSNDMNTELHLSLVNKCPLEQFCIFYNYRLNYLFNLGLPIIRFEDFINNNEETLYKICNILYINFDNKLLNSHKYYNKGQIGHGNTDLSSEIKKDVLTKYRLNITKNEFDYISEATKEVSFKYGYNFKDNEVILDKLKDMS